MPDENARRGLLPDPANPGQLINVGLAPGLAPYFPLWPEPNGPNLGGGVALAFSNPNQTIREEFGTVRVDHQISAKDSLSGIYTADDGERLTPELTDFRNEYCESKPGVEFARDAHLFSQRPQHVLGRFLSFQLCCGFYPLHKLS